MDQPRSLVESDPHEATGPNLDSVLCSVGGDHFEVVHAESGAFTEPVRGVMIYDADSSTDLYPGDLVLAVGIAPGTAAMRAVITNAAAQRCLAVVCKAASDDDLAELRADAARGPVTAIALDAKMSWDQIYMLIRTATSVRPATPLDSSGVPYGDLFTLTNAAAATLEGPVILDDENLQVIAFSNLEGPIDEIRRQSILRRRPPTEFLEWCETTGLLPKVRQSARPVRIQPPGGVERLVIAVKAGSEILGYLWVSEAGRPLNASAEDLLTEIGKVAALQIVHERVNADMDRRSKSDALRGALTGRGFPGTLSIRLGVPIDCLFRVIAFTPVTPAADNELQIMTVESLISLHFRAVAARSAVTHVGDSVYVFVPVKTEGELDRLRQWSEDIIGRSERQLKVTVRAAIGDRFQHLGDLPAAKVSVDRLLAMPTRGSARIICHDDAIPQTVLAELAEIFAERPHLLRSGVDRLIQEDRERGSDYLETLRIYLECNCDLTSAAKRLFVHRNTLKYRLGRIQEMSGLDLADPDVRLVTELHTRFLTHQMAAADHRETTSVDAIVAEIG